MTALLLLVVLGLAMAHWLLLPLTAALTPLLVLQGVPWLLLLVGLWLFAGSADGVSRRR